MDIILLIIIFVIALITSFSLFILAEHKEEIYKKISFKEKGKNER